MNTQPDGNFNPDEFSLVTLRTYRKRNVFINETLNGILCEAMTFHIKNRHIEIGGYAIMPDHVHILIKPADWTIPEFVNNFKTYTGIKVKSAGGFTRKVWRRRFYDVPVTDLSDFIKKIDKMHNNPVKKGLSESPEEYFWCSAPNYRGWPGAVPVSVFDLPKRP